MTSIPTIGDKKWELVQKWAASQEAILGQGLFDADAVDFFERAGVTNSIAKQQENALVLGLKANSLWDPLTFCQIGRSDYNAGSGTVVHDLKDAAMNGAFTNSPAWGSDGIVFTGNTQAVTTGRTQSMNSSWSAMVVMKNPTAAAGNQRILGANGASTLLFRAAANPASTTIAQYDGSAVHGSTSSINVTSMSLLATTYSAANLQRFYQGTTSLGATTGANIAGTMNVQLNASSGEGMNNATMAVAMLFGSMELTAAQESIVHNLLKATICSDLLP